MTSILLAMALSAVAAEHSLASDSGDNDIRNSVVKVHAVQRLPDMDRPWNKLAPRESTGSGVVLEGNRILTSAHD